MYFKTLYVINFINLFTVHLSQVYFNYKKNILHYYYYKTINIIIRSTYRSSH